MKDARSGISKAVTLMCAATLMASLAPDRVMAAAARSSTKSSKKKAVKISGSQLYRKLDSIEKQIDMLTKQGIKMAAPAPAAPAATGGSDVVCRALYNYGVYKKQAANLRMSAHLIRGIAILGGGVAMVHGWESEGDKVNRKPRTIHNAHSTYPWFSYGLSTAVLGTTISYIVDLMAISADKKAGKALMEPVVSGAVSQ